MRDSTPRIPKLCVAVSFHFVSERLRFLKAVAAELGSLADDVHLHVVTNATGDADRAAIRSAVGGYGFTVELINPTWIGHPFLLTWCHLDVFRQQLRDDRGITHFLYLEDDILIRPRNVAYWLRGREDLRMHGLIPSFLRVEYRAEAEVPFATDVTKRLPLGTLPALKLEDDYAYLNLPQPYQGMYLLDRALMEEHLAGSSSSPESGGWGIRERAAQGLTFAAVPSGCYSRNFIGHDLRATRVDPDCLIHHLPNNYANDAASVFAKIPVAELISLAG